MEPKDLLFQTNKKPAYRPAYKKRKLNNKKIVDAYIRNNFKVTATCNKLKISVETFYRWQREYPELTYQLALAKESLKDDVESALIKKAKEGDSQLLLYLAKTLLKDRGYGNEGETKQQNTQVNIVLPEDTSKKYEWWGQKPESNE